jgi:hypothetical protein
LLFLNSWDEFDDRFGDAISKGKLTGLELAIVTEDSLEMVKVNSCSNFLHELHKTNNPNKPKTGHKMHLAISLFIE